MIRNHQPPATSHQPPATSHHAFSLVELSIVLVILGLLTGGILAGQSLIRAAELRSVSSEYQRYVTAIQSFRDKYMALPGDMPNAQSFWGVAHATPATCKTTVGTGTQTCNGDGDGQISGAATGSNELFRSWQHLAAAGIIEGSYSGVQGPGGSQNYVFGTNTPSSRYTKGGWGMVSRGVQAGTSLAFGMDYGNNLDFGAADTVLFVAALLTPEEAWQVDTKLDDGRPGYGRLISRFWDTCTDAATNTDLDSDYLLTVSSRECALHFRQAF